jgi:hypothetical protein
MGVSGYSPPASGALSGAEKDRDQHVAILGGVHHKSGATTVGSACGDLYADRELRYR